MIENNGGNRLRNIPKTYTYICKIEIMRVIAMLHIKSILSKALTAIITHTAVFGVWEKNEKIIFQFKQLADIYVNKLRKS